MARANRPVTSTLPTQAGPRARLHSKAPLAGAPAASLVASKPRGKLIILVYVVCSFGPFRDKVGPSTPLYGSGSKIDAERTKN